MSFVTASLHPEIDEIVNVVRSERKFSQFVKIKLDSDFSKGQKILERLQKEFSDDSPLVLWSIDANACWTPEISLQYLDYLKSNRALMKRIHMIEQPFPLEFEKVVEVR